jgi:hypothetical protein
MYITEALDREIHLEWEACLIPHHSERKTTGSGSALTTSKESRLRTQTPREKSGRTRNRIREPTPYEEDRERRERSRSRARHGGRGNLPVIHTISGGFDGEGESRSARKSY